MTAWRREAASRTMTTVRVVVDPQRAVEGLFLPDRKANDVFIAQAPRLMPMRARLFRSMGGRHSTLVEPCVWTA